MTTVLAVHPPLLDLKETTPPTPVPVTLAEAKEYLRVDGTDQDATVTSLLLAATIWAEGHTRRAFKDRELAATFAALPAGGCALYLPSPPVRSLTSMTYQDSENIEQTIDVVLEVEVEPLYGILRELPGFTWPSGIRSATVTYNAGYGGADTDTPEQVRAAIKIAASQLFEYRTDQTVGAQLSTPQTKASEALLEHFRVYEF